MELIHLNIYDVLELIKIKIEGLNPVPSRYLISRGNANGFEELVPEIVDEISSEIKEQATLKSVVHYGKNFPDMDLILDDVRYGLELKSRNNGSWDVPGNSVFESVSDQNYEEIFLLFGSHKKGIPQIKIKYRPYWEVTAGIAVTHSPRFKINMNATESVFETSEDYKKLQNMPEEEKIMFLQSHLRNNTTGLKWFVPPTPHTIKPINLNSMKLEVKAQVISEVLVLYPQDLLNQPRGIYRRSTEHVLVSHFYYRSSFRDFFSASGKWEVNGVHFPKVLNRLYDNREIILDIIKNANTDFKELALASWSDFLDFTFTEEPFKDRYFIILDKIGEQHFAELLNDAKINRLSDFLSNYITFE